MARGKFKRLELKRLVENNSIREPNLSGPLIIFRTCLHAANWVCDCFHAAKIQNGGGLVKKKCLN